MELMLVCTIGDITGYTASKLREYAGESEEFAYLAETDILNAGNDSWLAEYYGTVSLEGLERTGNIRGPVNHNGVDYWLLEGDYDSELYRAPMHL